MVLSGRHAWGQPTISRANFMKFPTVLALDLEGTLISNAASQIPRPGLYEFLDRCTELFPRIVMYTTVSEQRFRPIAQLLTDEGFVPPWFSQVENVIWTGATKDLAMVRGANAWDCLLVDDYEGYVHPGQHNQWIRIACFAYPYDASDCELAETLVKLGRRVA